MDNQQDNSFPAQQPSWFRRPSPRFAWKDLIRAQMAQSVCGRKKPLRLAVDNTKPPTPELNHD